jgi:putative phosphoribosyl transferase
MSGTAPFADRESAGRELAARLAPWRDADPVVLALPRGGVAVAAPIAVALHAPLDVLLVRKIGAPEEPELAYAAIVDGDPPQVVVNDEVARWVRGSDAWLARQVARETAEIERRRRVYVADRVPLPVESRTTIVVDDGLATGTTARAALLALRKRQPARLVLAVPVAPMDTIEALRPLADEIVCLRMPSPFRAIGLHYRDFHQLDDAEVVQLLVACVAQAARPRDG